MSNIYTKINGVLCVKHEGNDKWIPLEKHMEQEEPVLYELIKKSLENRNKR